MRCECCNFVVLFDVISVDKLNHLGISLMYIG